MILGSTFKNFGDSHFDTIRRMIYEYPEIKTYIQNKECQSLYRLIKQYGNTSFNPALVIPSLYKKMCTLIAKVDTNFANLFLEYILAESEYEIGMEYLHVDKLVWEEADLNKELTINWCEIDIVEIQTPKVIGSMMQIEAYNYWFMNCKIKKLLIINHTNLINQKLIEDKIVELFKEKNYYPLIEEVEIVNR